MMKTSFVRGLKAMHPGELLREEVLPATARTKTEIARLLGVSRQHLYAILDERKPVSPAMALRFGKLFGNGPEFWVDLQRAYDLAEATRKMGAEIDRIPTLSAA